MIIPVIILFFTKCDYYHILKIIIKNARTLLFSYSRESFHSEVFIRDGTYVMEQPLTGQRLKLK